MCLTLFADPPKVARIPGVVRPLVGIVVLEAPLCFSISTGLRCPDSSMFFSAWVRAGDAINLRRTTNREPGAGNSENAPPSADPREYHSASMVNGSRTCTSTSFTGMPERFLSACTSCSNAAILAPEELVQAGLRGWGSGACRRASPRCWRPCASRTRASGPGSSCTLGR